MNPKTFLKIERISEMYKQTQTLFNHLKILEGSDSGCNLAKPKRQSGKLPKECSVLPNCVILRVFKSSRSRLITLKTLFIAHLSKNKRFVLQNGTCIII